MKINLIVEIDEPKIDLDHYKCSETPITTPEEAVKYDLDMFEAGEVALEDVIYNFGGDVTVKVLSVDEIATNTGGN
ncbi:hypothetical protein SEA_GOURDTHYMES_48 [Gordonia phage GourdThymes]|uniref:Uncharacterized protein n=14 Tax=Montyvirus TaxID=2733196 RepID=A0A2L1IVF1_9CAUD|nr:hypothetical protein BH763_gp082 [Gordonia phage Monty]YP_009300998.1 hypothetical protein BJD64_gp085 [Gordonia phage Hotorobo]YP_009795632.1 hypothetical protein HOS45_gp082 [Gordonia phage BirksAndSocks]YP_009797890.1 hypothetical protein HOS74_gp084 [Gordonia phage Flakey]YP_009837016.1 hypothetical protein HWB50_gp084 [Gordonia phage Adgers]YP_009843042.1 hypothetical protein HWC02_gp084 [Gordonia phage Sombrero]YP_009848332.1 hypothetical protein HWC39_gp082 [Gordonia phage Beaver]Y